MNTYICDGCSLCCRKLIIEADAIDVLREPRIAERIKHGKRVSLPLTDRCWLLYDEKTKACPFIQNDNRCEIYPTRPLTCVQFQAGSKKCQELRKDYGLEPLAPDSEERDSIPARIQKELREMFDKNYKEI